MDTIDAMGDRPERRRAFHRELLAETDDAELKAIAESAADDLGAPIALVSLVLDQIQYFKAHHGLPGDLAAARGMHRGASFCQFVVRDADIFEIGDAAADTELPQFFVKDYGIRSYLGVPIHLGSVVLGSLCVLDTKPRQFTTAERERMRELAERVDRRLLELTTRRREARLAMSQDATAGALQEIRESLAPMRHGLRAGLPSLNAIRSFLRLVEFVEEGGTAQPTAVAYALEAAFDAVEESEEVLYNIEAAVADCEDCLDAVESLASSGNAVRLSDVLHAAQDLSRQATRAAGGAPLPALDRDPELAAPRSFVVALMTTCLTQVALRLAGDDASGIRLSLRFDPNHATVVLQAPGLDDEGAREVSERLNEQLGDDPSVAISASGPEVMVRLHILTEPDVAVADSH